jgi:cell division protein FtsB
MAEFRKRKKVRNFLHSKPVLLVLATIAVVFAFNIVGIANKSIETKRNKNSAHIKVQELTRKEERLRADIERLSTPEGQEAAVREKFRVAKEGEGLIVITEPVTTPQQIEVPKQEGFWSFFKNIFE